MDNVRKARMDLIQQLIFDLTWALRDELGYQIAENRYIKSDGDQVIMSLTDGINFNQRLHTELQTKGLYPRE